LSNAYLVTGSSGFIGTHVAHQSLRYAPGKVDGLDLAPPASPAGYRHLYADIREPDSIASLAANGYHALIHLAARAEVMTAFDKLGDLSLTNVNGTANVLEGLRPKTFVFASTSAIYGHGGSRPIPACPETAKPIGTYGVSKLFGEMIVSEWCRHGFGAGIAFRFGNVVGPRCRGLIPFLVEHAVRNPKGESAAQCRAGGTILRDYVPVDFLVKLLWSAAIRRWEPGEFRVFNVGTGTGMTNGDVASIVADVLRTKGYTLRIRWDAPLEPGESNSIVLDMEETARTFQCSPPERKAVAVAVEQAVLTKLDLLRDRHL
jgi:nucleoside-diphosphate-sugar epimerase